MTGATISGEKFFRCPLPKLGGQNSHGEAFLFRMTVLASVLDRRKVCRQAENNEKGGSRSIQNGFRLLLSMSNRLHPQTKSRIE